MGETILQYKWYIFFLNPVSLSRWHFCLFVFFTDLINYLFLLTKKDGERVWSAYQLVEHVTVDSLDGVDELAIVLVGQPLIEQFAASQVAYTTDL